MTRDKFVAYSVAAMCFGLWISDALVANAKPMGPSLADKIAEACIPENGERKVVEMSIGETGEKSVTVTTQQFIGTRKGIAQYEIVSSESLK